MNNAKMKWSAGVMLAALGLGNVVADPLVPPAAGRASTAEPAAAPAATEIRYRKNIDDLTDEELKAYRHAVHMMKVKSQNNVFDRTGFLWQAWVHNCPSVDVLNVLDGRRESLSKDSFKNLLSQNDQDSCDIRNFLDVPGSAKTHKEFPGQCEHRKNTFLQWHRAQLYYYEQALRNADPEGKFGPSTRNVTLPYWNFTRRPSGARYPKAFEDPASPLFDETRTRGALPSSLPTSSPYLLAYLIYKLDWAGFGGDEYGTNGGGGLETKIHNKMHSGYINGNMGSNVTAGLDPLFYVFHNFLDYALEQWIKEHGAGTITGTGRSATMRGEQDADLPRPVGYSGSVTKGGDSGNYVPDMGQAELYFDTKRQGYAFQSRDDELISKSEIDALIARHQEAGFTFGDHAKSLFSALLSDGDSGAVDKPQIKLHGTYHIDRPVDAGHQAKLRFTRKTVATDYSFQADIYLYPPSVKENIADKNFRDRYLVTNTAHWALHGHGDHGNHGNTGVIEVTEDVSAIVNSLISKKRGETWNITLALSAPPGKDAAAIQKGDFTPPAILVESKPLGKKGEK